MWSSSEVFDQQKKKAKELGLRLYVLDEELTDVVGIKNGLISHNNSGIAFGMQILDATWNSRNLKKFYIKSGCWGKFKDDFFYLFFRNSQARIQDFLKGGGGDSHGGPLRGGGVIAPVGEKLLFEHTKFSATRGGDHPYHPPPPPWIRHWLSCIEVFNNWKGHEGDTSWL